MLITGDTDRKRLIDAAADGFMMLHKQVEADDLRQALACFAVLVIVGRVIRRYIQSPRTEKCASLRPSTSLQIRRCRTFKLFAFSISATCFRLRPNGSDRQQHWFRVRCPRHRPSPMVRLRLSDRIQAEDKAICRAFANQALASHQRHVWPLMVIATGGRASLPKAFMTSMGTSTSVAFQEGITAARNFNFRSP